MSDCRATSDGYYTDEHLDDCNGVGCRGCWPCVPVSAHGDPLNHCTARAKCSNHVEPGTLSCPRCVGRTRDALADIERLAADMPGEALERGVNSEAAMLAGPALDTADDIAAYGYRQRSIVAGRVLGAIEHTGRHPLNILGTWEQMLREDYQQPSRERMTVATVVAYLDGQLDRLAQDEEQDFGQFVREVTACRSHLEAVVRDHGMGDRAGVGCFDCGGQLERRLTTRGFEDHWTCRDCRRQYTYAEYNFALRAALEGRTA
jgi:hypothetical protein